MGQTTKTKNEGEGSYEGTRRYDAGVRETVKSGIVEKSAREAESAIDSKAEEAAKRGPQSTKKSANKAVEK